MRQKRILPVLLLILLFARVVYAFTSKVIGVTDGDTVVVLTKDKAQVKVRLYGIDCPKKSQASGSKAKHFTADMVFGKKVDVEPVDRTAMAGRRGC
ncbi:MAG: thermonuclease family protein [Desulfovibrionaceae bacterium]|nr:thermonuclease family protein [Desulfovibrionaceae bacterium]